MNTRPLTFLCFLSLAGLLLSGCGNEQSNNTTLTDINSTQPTAYTEAVNSILQFSDDVKTALLSSNSILSQDLKNTLAYMGNEERLAFDMYSELYKLYPQKQFYNIANNSESVHIRAVQFLVQKYITDYAEFTNTTSTELSYKETPIAEMQTGVYDVQAVQDLYNTLYNKGKVSTQDALEVGCMIEVTDINDLSTYIDLANDTNATDVATVFDFLRQGSYQHYWAFDGALKTLGITDGCCGLGTIDSINYCHPEYPQNAAGHGSH